MASLLSLSRKVDMDCHILIFLACAVLSVSAWSAPFYPVHRYTPVRVTRYAPHPPHRIPIPVRHEEPQFQRPKRDQDDHDDYDHAPEKETRGSTGPVHTFVKTDKNANYKWGVRHHVGNKYAP